MKWFKNDGEFLKLMLKCEENHTCDVSCGIPKYDLPQLIAERKAGVKRRRRILWMDAQCEVVDGTTLSAIWYTRKPVVQKRNKCSPALMDKPQQGETERNQTMASFINFSQKGLNDNVDTINLAES